jgi:hypothetical protein
LRLTVRDLLLMEFLSEQGLATADQLTERFFPNKECFWTRVRPLLKNGYLESTLLLSFASAVPSRMLPLVKKLREERRNVEKLKVYSLGSRFKEKAKHSLTIVAPMFAQHQLGLNELRRFLEKTLPPEGIYLSDPEIRLEELRLGSIEDIPIPDLVWRAQGRSYAFELERNQKSNLRYFERFSRYEKSGYERIVYFCENETLYEDLLEKAARFPKIGFSLTNKPSKVFSRFRGSQTVFDFLGVGSGRS